VERTLLLGSASGEQSDNIQVRAWDQLCEILT